MYKKAIGLLVSVYLFLLGTVLILMGMTRLKERLDEQVESVSEEWTQNVQQIGIAQYSSSDKRVVDYLHLVQPADEEEYSREEIAVLERIVEAEAGGEDEEGKILVANVVLNRVRDEAFPDTISGVVYQKSNGVTQFSPVANGRIHRVTVSEESAEAVKRALNGEDYSKGALYFAARQYADSKNMEWFDEHLTFLFQHGGHEFFK